jgi:4'-phosphopantetheinyl transferase
MWYNVCVSCCIEERVRGKMPGDGEDPGRQGGVPHQVSGEGVPMVFDPLNVDSPLQTRPPGDLRLNRDDVHVWRTFVDPPTLCVERFVPLLSRTERIRAQRFHFERDRKRFIARRGLLRVILGRYLDIAPGELAFCYGSHGKPSIAPQQNQAELSFSVSHSQGVIVYGIAHRRNIGIDIEGVRPIPQMEGLTEYVLSSREQARFRELLPSQRLLEFLRCWTRKEAFLKACGDGLSRSLRDFSVSLSSDGPARLLNVDWDPDEVSRWSLLELACIPGYLGALCVEGSGWRATCGEWPVL